MSTETLPANPAADITDDDTIDGKQAAKILKCSYQMVLKLAKNGKLPHYQIGDLKRFSRSEVLAYLNQSKVTPNG